MELDGSDVGVVCITRENLQSPWLLFEAGALAKRVGTAKVCTLLVDVGELSQPLSAFQAARLSKDGIFRIVRTIHAALPEPLLNAEQLKKTFDVWWPALDKELLAAMALPAHTMNALQQNTEEFLLPRASAEIRSGEIDSVLDWLNEARNKGLIEPTSKLASVEACLARIAGKTRAPMSLKHQSTLRNEIGAVARVEWWFQQFAAFKRLDEIQFQRPQLDGLPLRLKSTASALLGLWNLREEKTSEASRYHRECAKTAIAGDPHDYYRTIPTALLCFNFGDLKSATKFFELPRNGYEMINDGYPFLQLISDFDRYFVLSCISKNASPPQAHYMRHRRGQGWLLQAYADLVRKKPAILAGLVHVGKNWKPPLESDAITGRLKSFYQVTLAASGGFAISD